MKYLYIDERKDARQAVQNFIIEGKLEIEHKRPTKKRKDIIDIIKNYDGLIIDQQLDEETIIDEEGNGFISDYYGSSLAMDIRIKENEIKQNTKEDVSVPIVLYSANRNVPNILKGLGEDIFDMRIYKADTQYIQKIPKYRTQLFSLAKGYKELKSKPEICSCLRIDDFIGEIDNRFLTELKRRANFTAHSKATFILNELIIKQGILIDEDILAVRLGIDKKASETGWQMVLESLKEFNVCYRGVFCEGWLRWWMPMVDKWWSEVIGGETYLQFLSASLRAKKISEKLDIHLEVASAKSRFSVSDDYWTVCSSSKEPLSIENGLMLPGQENLYPWQDARYVSIMSAIEESLDIADFENERLDYYKTILNQPNNDNR